MSTTASCCRVNWLTGLHLYCHCEFNAGQRQHGHAAIQPAHAGARCLGAGGRFVLNFAASLWVGVARFWGRMGQAGGAPAAEGEGTVTSHIAVRARLTALRACRGSRARRRLGRPGPGRSRSAGRRPADHVARHSATLKIHGIEHPQAAERARKRSTASSTRSWNCARPSATTSSRPTSDVNDAYRQRGEPHGSGHARS